jgi:TPR repeat protein
MNHALAISPDGHFFASAGEKFTMRVYDIQTGREHSIIKTNLRYIYRCAWSPDGRYIITVSDDHSIRVWDIVEGSEKANLPLMGGTKLILHPYLPIIFSNAQGGQPSRIDLIGIKYGPIIVTAQQGGKGFVFQCPACHHQNMIQKDQLGCETTCSTPNCGLQIKLNPFVLNIKENKTSPAPAKPSSEPTIKVPSQTENSEIDRLIKRAQGGDARSQFVLGLRYDSGKGVPCDGDQAIQWFRKAADQGFDLAIKKLRTIELKQSQSQPAKPTNRPSMDQSIKQQKPPKQIGDSRKNSSLDDLGKKANLLAQAEKSEINKLLERAQGGDARAQYTLGMRYDTGYMVPRDKEKAIYWYRKAANQGFWLAEEKLKTMELKQNPSQPAISTNRPSRGQPIQHQKSPNQTGDSLKNTPLDDLGKQAKLLRSQGDLEGALKLYKQQENILRAQGNPVALRANLIIQKELVEERIQKLKTKSGKTLEELKKLSRKKRGR